MRGGNVSTLKDVAKVAQVSTTTVSRFLNGDPALNIPDDTRNRILRATEQVRYQVKPRRREIGRNNIQRVGVVAYKNEESELSDPYFLQIRRGVEQACRARGFSGSLTLQWADLVNSYSSFDDLGGVVVIGENHAAADYFRHRSQRVVFVDRCVDPDRYDSVVVDFYRATRAVIDHLLRVGHRTVGFIGSLDIGLVSDPRQEAFQAYMSARGLYRPEHMFGGRNWSVNEGYELGRAAIAAGPLASAYFVASDPLAVGVMRAMAEAGYRVPEDVGIVGFDDIEMAGYLTPPLTTVHVPTEAMGRLAVDLLLDGIGNPSMPLQIVVPTELKVRSSCGYVGRAREEGAETG